MDPPTHRPLAWIDDELKALQQQGLRRFLINRGGSASPIIKLDGTPLVHFGSNDYLGLAADPRVVEAAIAALNTAGWGSGASPLISGHSAIHAELERRLAAFEGTEAALVFASGFAANSGTIAAGSFLRRDGEAVGRFRGEQRVARPRLLSLRGNLRPQGVAGKERVSVLNGPHPHRFHWSHTVSLRSGRAPRCRSGNVRRT